MLNRRDLLKRAAVAGLAVAGVAMTAEQAEAARAWCRVDPTIRVNGHDFDAQIGIFGDLGAILDNEIAPIDIDIYLKTNTSHSVVNEDDGFANGYNIQFHWDATLTDANRIRAKARIHMNGNDPYDNTPWDFYLQIIPAPPQAMAQVYGSTPNYTGTITASVG